MNKFERRMEISKNVAIKKVELKKEGDLKRELQSKYLKQSHKTENVRKELNKLLDELVISFNLNDERLNKGIEIK